MSSSAIVVVVLVAFVPMFVATWLVACALVSNLGGWRALAARFPASGRRGGQVYRFVTVILERGRAPVRYRGCAMVSFDQEGVGLAVFPVFRSFHPKVYMPRSATANCRVEQRWLSEYAVVEVPECGVTIRFSGRVGKELAAAWGMGEPNWELRNSG